MDRWRTHHKEGLEREAQQLLVRENNRGDIACGTDYFIVDTEYALSEESFRFDAVAVRWRSTSAARRRTRTLGLSLVELKFGDDALGGSSGLAKHVKDAETLAANPTALALLREEALTLFNQKRALGLLDCKLEAEAFADEPLELVLVLANHDPASSRLFNALRKLPPHPHARLRLAAASFFGYGLYENGFLDVEEFLARAPAEGR